MKLACVLAAFVDSTKCSDPETTERRDGCFPLCHIFAVVTTGHLLWSQTCKHVLACLKHLSTVMCSSFLISTDRHAGYTHLMRQTDLCTQTGSQLNETDQSMIRNHRQVHRDFHLYSSV